MKEQIYRYIGQNHVEYAGTLFALEEPDAEVAYASDEGFMLRCGRLDYVSARSDAALRSVRPLIDGDLVVSYDDCTDALLLERGYQRELDCYNCLYEQTEPIRLSLPDGVQIRRLSHAYDQFVISHYSHADGRPDYVIERVEAGMYGIFEDGAIAGFIGTHDTGELGMLEILPPFRRKGYAFLLEAHLINQLLKEDRVIYCNVETENEPSLALQRRLGMTISTGHANWFWNGRD